MHSRSVATIVMAVFICAGGLPGQSTFGSFVGTVHDPSGGVIAECLITLTNIGTSARRSAATDKEGNYVLVNIEPGKYQIVMQAPGFQPLTLANLEITARQTLRADGTLALAGQAQTVDVTSSGVAPVTTEVSNIAESKSGRELVELPVAIGS